jgi:serine/threonine-protein kinase
MLAGALERAPADRAAYLDQVSIDPSLRREVESLLAHEKEAERFLEAPALEVAAKMLGNNGPGQSLIGRQIGSYQVLSLLGVGGMGEVYQAHDTKLGREVAIKVLPAGFVHDPERLSRFQREARMLAALNHPNIATIYGLEQSGGAHYLVMELVLGETLAERVGALKIEEALKIAVQIAEALEAAHEKGVIHRDLKPANVKVTPEGRVKVLDFGLAKAFAGDAGLDLSNAPTLTAMGTEEGRILGTPAYMSPEQARGKAVDKRTDIWAFGCVLYELLTARQAFRGETGQDTIAAVLEREPDWLALPPPTPAQIRKLLRRCLQKDPQRRLRDLGDARLEIEETLIPPVAEPTGQRDLDLADGNVPTSRRRLPPARQRGESPGRDFIAGRREARWISVLALTILLAALFGLNVGGWRERLLTRNRTPRISSLAVLPLENFSRDPEQEYFADGMTEALITDLSKISALRVISRTSVMQYKGVKRPLPEIAKALQVDAVIEGSVERVGDRVRITAQLIQAANDKHLWAESYDRDLREVLALQDQVARQIATAVQVKLTPQERERLSSGGPTNSEAYQLYLLGRYHWNKGTQQELTKSMEYYQQALAKDPNYALAYAGLADSYSSLSDWYLPPRQVMPQAKAATMKALELDQSLAAAHNALCSIYTNYDWDWQGANKECQRAVELNPNSADAHDNYASELADIGQWDKMAVEIRRSEELDPLSFRIYSDAAQWYWLARQDDRAVDQLRKAIELEPDYFLAHTWLGVVYAHMGRLPEAVAETQKGAQLSDSPLARAVMGYAYALAGRSSEARKVADELAAKRGQNYLCPYEIGTIYVGLGQKDEAFRWLERAYDERSYCIPALKFDTRLDPIRSDPRLEDLIRRVGFPEL